MSPTVAVRDIAMNVTHLSLDTLARQDKGPVAPPPKLDGMLGLVADTVQAWPGVIATVHWHLAHRDRIDGVDFYVGEKELGHLHLDGWIHLATPSSLGDALIARGLAQRFAYARGWVQARADVIGADAAIDLFRSNHDRMAENV